MPVMARSSGRTPAPPEFLDLACHPVRWRLLLELAHSDRQVEEMVELVGQPQALVSYHLRRLRAGGLVSSRRSSRDARAVYYRADLDRCVESLSMTGSLLHRGLDVELSPLGDIVAPRDGGEVRVLFVCTGNSARSQIAEALMKRETGGALDVVSAGSDPKPVHPHAVQALAARGIDISGWRAKPLSDFAGQRFEYVVTMCDKVRERCPEFAGEGQRIHWSIEDPSHPRSGGRVTYDRFQRLTTEVENRVRWLTRMIARTQPTKARTTKAQPTKNHPTKNQPTGVQHHDD